MECTPKYCARCGIFWGFRTPQLWQAHILSKKLNSKVGKRIPSVYCPRNLIHEFDIYLKTRMTIRKEKRDQISNRITKRLLFGNSNGEIVLNVYESILNSIDQISIDYQNDYRN